MNDRPLDDAALIRAFQEAGQGGVFRFRDRLNKAEFRALVAEARTVDLDLVARLTREATAGEGPAPDLAPLDPVGPDSPDFGAAVAAGRDLLAAGRVAFYTVAGGQGSRLGSLIPKGCFPVGPATGRTLFSWHAGKVLAASRRYGCDIPWVLMVSSANHDDTRAHFEENDWFGLEGRTRFVEQDMLPATDETGKILLANPGRIALAPNGHGGSIAALWRGQTADWLRDRGVTTLSYFQVDNPLINAADPAFLGYHAMRDADVSAKVVRKSHPGEKAGVVALVNGRPGVVEYTEISEEQAAATDEHGELRYGLANIAAHAFDLDFIEKIHDRGLPFHLANKKSATVDDDGNPVRVMGHKFETFVFDSIPMADRFVAFLTDREQDFAPLKNAEGDDSPETVRRALFDRARSWYERAGFPVPESEEELEVGPERGYDFETFSEWNQR
ncbi:MAG: UTP--glucose-1-phosphate uridylyltransferase [Planctomycetota bacterium]